MKKRLLPFSCSLALLFSCTGNHSVAPIEQTIEKAKGQTESIKPIKVEDLSEGKNLVRYPSGVKQYQGEVLNGKRQGPWMYWYKDGSIWSECEYNEGKKNGKTAVWFENGKRRYEGEYKNDVKSGKWTYWDETGNLAKELAY